MEKILRDEIFKYGFLPMLVVLERMEQSGEYEICQAIINTLKKHSEEFDLDLPTKYSGEAVAQYKLAFMTTFNLSGDIAARNDEYYADEIAIAIHKYITLQVN